MANARSWGWGVARVGDVINEAAHHSLSECVCCGASVSARLNGRSLDAQRGLTLISEAGCATRTDSARPPATLESWQGP